MRQDAAGIPVPDGRPRRIPFAVASPRPCIAKPHRWQNVQWRRVGSAIVDGDADQQIFGLFLRVFHCDVEIPIVVEGVGIAEFEFAFIPSAAAILFHQRGIRKGALRILVQRLEVRRGRRRVEVVVALLHVLAVIAFRARQPEQPLFENRVLFIPERQRKTETALSIRNAEQAILAPAIGATARVVVREVVPAVAIGGIVFADRTPLALSQVRPPSLPVRLPSCVFVQPPVFCRMHVASPAWVALVSSAGRE